MRSRRAARLLIFVVVWLLYVSIPLAGQIGRERFAQLISDNAALTESELSSLQNGETVVKILKAADKREVSVFGVVRLREAGNIDLAAFREALSQKNNKAMLGGGILSTPPVLQDLAGLRLDDKDIRGLANCMVGDCDLKLSTPMIRRFQAEIDWSAVGHEIQASELFKQMLVEYARDYLKSGDKALLEYADHNEPVSLETEYGELLNEAVLIRSFAPEFENYLKKYPAAQLSGVDGRLDWSKVDSGIKPIVTLTHGAGYSRQTNDGLLLALVTKQIYASHYVDASLGFSAFVRFGAGESADAYLIFTSISRSDSLRGRLSGMAHKLVEREALQKASDLLQTTKVRIEAKERASQESVVESPERGFFAKVSDFSQIPAVRVFAILIFAAIIGFAVLRWRAGR
ncbi:MAG: hypothetical protein ABL999_14195 [Pyrinomonadaceae bacterium]